VAGADLGVSGERVFLSKRHCFFSFYWDLPSQLGKTERLKKAKQFLCP
jgi:hypothetical protein